MCGGRMCGHRLQSGSPVGSRCTESSTAAIVRCVASSLRPRQAVRRCSGGGWLSLRIAEVVKCGTTVGKMREYAEANVIRYETKREGGGAEIARQQIATGWTSVGPRKIRACWTISELNPVCHDSTAALIVACSFCVQSAILSALIRSPYSRGSTTEVTATAARTKTRTGMALAVSTAPPSGAPESATAAAATTSDDCSKVCIVAPRAGFVDSIQDDAVMTKKTFRNWSVSQSHNQSLVYSAPKHCPELANLVSRT